MGKKLTVDVLNRLLGPVDENNLEEDVIVVNLGDSLSVDWVGVTCQLVDLLVNVVLNFTHEVGCFNTTLADLFCDIEVALRVGVLALKLSEGNALVRLSNGHVFCLHLLVQSGPVRGE